MRSDKIKQQATKLNLLLVISVVGCILVIAISVKPNHITKDAKIVNNYDNIHRKEMVLTQSSIFMLLKIKYGSNKEIENKVK